MSTMLGTRHCSLPIGIHVDDYVLTVAVSSTLYRYLKREKYTPPHRNPRNIISAFPGGMLKMVHLFQKFKSYSSLLGKPLFLNELLN